MQKHQEGLVKAGSGADSAPDFSLLPRSFKANTSRRHKATTSNGSGGAGRGIDASGGSNGGEQNFISRKTAQTFLSGLSKGYISKIDNVKLIKSCLSGKNNAPKKVRASQEFEGKSSEPVDTEAKAVKDLPVSTVTQLINTWGDVEAATS